MSGIWMSVKEIPSVSFSGYEKLSLENVTTLIGRSSKLCRSLLYCSWHWGFTVVLNLVVKRVVIDWVVVERRVNCSRSGSALRGLIAHILKDKIVNKLPVTGRVWIADIWLSGCHFRCLWLTTIWKPDRSKTTDWPLRTEPFKNQNWKCLIFECPVFISPLSFPCSIQGKRIATLFMLKLCLIEFDIYFALNINNRVPYFSNLVNIPF